MNRGYKVDDNWNELQDIIVHKFTQKSTEEILQFLDLDVNTRTAEHVIRRFKYNLWSIVHHKI